MRANVKLWSAFITLVWIFIGPMTVKASAETVELAKKCNALTAKAFPPRVVGNPAAGSAKGGGKVRQDYYRKCVANGGNVDDDAGKGAK